MTYELVPSTAQVMPEGQRGLRPARRTAAVMGGLAVAVIAVAAIVAWVADRDDSVSDEALFVLPESPLPGARWEPVVTAVGDSYRRVDDSMTFAHEEYEGGWRVVSSPSDLVHAYAMLINDIASDLVLVFAPPETSLIPMTSFVMTSPEGSTFTVETATGSPLFDAATFAERVEPVDINATAGWVIVDDGEDPTATVVTWSPETGRTVSVRSSAPRDAVLDAARRLQPVPADEWTSSFPELGRD